MSVNNLSSFPGIETDENYAWHVADDVDVLIDFNDPLSLTLLFQQIDIALKNQWFRQNRNFFSVSLIY